MDTDAYYERMADEYYNSEAFSPYDTEESPTYHNCPECESDYDPRDLDKMSCPKCGGELNNTEEIIKD